MQDCFRQHPEMYASELADDEDDEELQEEIRARDTADAPDSLQEAPKAQTTPESESSKPSLITSSESTKPEEPRSASKEIANESQKSLDNLGDTVPK